MVHSLVNISIFRMQYISGALLFIFWDRWDTAHRHVGPKWANGVRWAVSRHGSVDRTAQNDSNICTREISLIGPNRTQPYIFPHISTFCSQVEQWAGALHELKMSAESAWKMTRKPPQAQPHTLNFAPNNNGNEIRCHAFSGIVRTMNAKWIQMAHILSSLLRFLLAKSSSYLKCVCLLHSSYTFSGVFVVPNAADVNGINIKQCDEDECEQTK